MTALDLSCKPTLTEILDAAYNVVRPQYNQSMYPVVEDKSVITLDPLSIFVADSAEHRGTALKFIAAMSVVGSVVERTSNKMDTLAHSWSSLPDKIAELNMAANKLLPQDSNFVAHYIGADNPRPLVRSLLIISETLAEIHPATWLQLDSETVRFARALVEFATIVQYSK